MVQRLTYRRRLSYNTTRNKTTVYVSLCLCLLSVALALACPLQQRMDVLRLIIICDSIIFSNLYTS